MASHYSNVQQPALLQAKADLWAKWLMRECKARGKGQTVAPILVYTGLSGIGSATALSMRLASLSGNRFKFGMIYVRKPNERSHGSKIETQLDEIGDMPVKLFFVDDFISAGYTFTRTMLTAIYYQYRGTIGQNLDFSKFGVIEMTHSPRDLDSRVTPDTWRQMEKLFKRFQVHGDPDYPEAEKLILNKRILEDL